MTPEDSTTPPQATVEEIAEHAAWQRRVQLGILHSDAYNERMIGIDLKQKARHAWAAEQAARIYDVPASLLTAPVDTSHSFAYPSTEGWRAYEPSEVVEVRSVPGHRYYLVRSHAPIEGVL